METMQERIGRVLAELRKAQDGNVSLRDAEDLVGIDHAAIARIEKGERLPSLLTLQKFARGYNTTIISILKRAKVR